MRDLTPHHVCFKIFKLTQTMCVNVFTPLRALPFCDLNVMARIVWKAITKEYRTVLQNSLQLLWHLIDLYD